MTTQQAHTIADYKTSESSWWCPGCGDFGVLAALQKAVMELGMAPEDVAIVAGIGCSGKIGNYINSYNIHTTHGRTMPVALGLKLANRELTVIAAGGDGDGFAIGMGHFVHALRRNPDVTYVVMDNQIYGLTKGQVSPTSMEGFETRSTPSGSIEHPIRPLQLAIATGATFVAQGFSSKQKQLVEILKAAIAHRGFSLVNTFSPCVTFNKVNTYDYYKAELKDLDSIPGYDRHNRQQAMATLMEYDERITGIVYEKEDSSPLEDKLPGFRAEGLAKQSLDLNPADFNRLVAGYR
jgi:2-oxoglutarate ferredoxin oxidoreductase subunit beta